jgi:hypothetical protein
MSKTLSIVKVVGQLERVPENMKHVGKQAGKKLAGWRRVTMRAAKHNPGRAVLGALVAGFVFAKLTRLFG